MKVKHHSDDYLVLGDVPWLLSIALIGGVLVFVFVGLKALEAGQTWQGVAFAVGGGGLMLAILVAFARRSQVIFDRVQGRLTRRSRSFLGYKQEHWPLEDVERAISEKLSDSEGDTFRPTLLMRQGSRRIPLMITYGGEKSAERAVNAINTWLAALDSDDKAP